MQSSFSEQILWFCIALTIPWLCLRSTQWIVLRSGEERLRAIPVTLWQPLYTRLLAYSSDLLYRLVQDLTAQQIYHALNPERCTQQTLKVLMPYIESLTDQLIQPLSPVIWDNVPLALRTPIYQRVGVKFRPCIDELVNSMQLILAELFNHQQFIANRIKKFETGYRFICTEALHNYWHTLHSKSLSLTLLLLTLYLFIINMWPFLDVQVLFILIPLISTLLTSLLVPALHERHKTGFARCLGFWFGERLYLIDELVRAFASTESNKMKIRPIVIHAFAPLIEDAPLRALAQIALGRRALIELRTGLVEFVLHNGSIPFEHSQFKQERSLEVSTIFEQHLNTLPLIEINMMLKPILRTLQGIMIFAACSIALFFIFISWYLL